MTKEQLIELVKFTAGEIVAPNTLNDEDAESIVDDFAHAEQLPIHNVSNRGGAILYDSLSDSFKKSIDSIEDNLNR